MTRPVYFCAQDIIEKEADVCNFSTPTQNMYVNLENNISSSFFVLEVSNF